MNKRIVVVALSVCALIGIALARHAVSGPQQAELDLPQVKQLLGYTMARLAVPQQAGLPFDVNVSLGGLNLVLSLQPHSIRSADFQLLVDHGDGVLVPADAAPPNTYRGTIEGMPGGWVTASLIEGRLYPLDSDLESDETLDAWIRRNVETGHHVSCTAKMGPESDPMAVVDQYGRVHGADGLRVADASIMPECVRANINVTVMMMGERIADFITQGS